MRRRVLGMAAAVGLGGLGWAVAQEPPTPPPPALELSAIKLPVPVPATPTKALSRPAKESIQRLRERTRQLTAAAAAFQAEQTKWMARREVQVVAVKTELGAVTAVETELAADRARLPDIPFAPAAVGPTGSPPAPLVIDQAVLLKAKLAATAAARDRQQRLLDHIGQRIAHLDAAMAGFEKQKADAKEQMARIYFEALDEDGKGYDLPPSPLPPDPAPPTGEAWADHTQPWPPAAGKKG